MNMPPLTIRKPETLAARIDKIEAEVFGLASDLNEKVGTVLRINGFLVEYTVTPSIRPGRFYRLFRANGRRIAKESLQSVLLESAA